jgi:hypothetical protein
MDTPPLRVQTRAGASAVRSGVTALDVSDDLWRTPARDERNFRRRWARARKSVVVVAESPDDDR